MAHMFESFSMRSYISIFRVRVVYNGVIYGSWYTFDRDKSSISVDELLVFFRENINGFVSQSSSKKFDASLLNNKICSFSTCKVYDGKKFLPDKIQEITDLSSDKTIKNLDAVGAVEIDLDLKDKLKTDKPIQKEDKKEEKCCCR